MLWERLTGFAGGILDGFFLMFFLSKGIGWAGHEQFHVPCVLLQPWIAVNSGYRSGQLCYAVTFDSQQPCQEEAGVTDLSLSFVGCRFYQSLSRHFIC